MVQEKEMSTLKKWTTSDQFVIRSGFDLAQIKENTKQ
jgi:hypothetical protein